MKLLTAYITIFCLIAQCLQSESTINSNTFTIVTLNCMWFFSPDGSDDKQVHNTERPKNQEQYEHKAGHLIGLLPQQPPLFVGFQEIGGEDDVNYLAQSASRRYGRAYQSLFIQGKDSYTGQDVAAIFDPSQGWQLHGQPDRHSDLEKKLSKHLLVSLMMNSNKWDICNVHLRVPRREYEGQQKHQEQNQALLKWSMRHLGPNTNANVTILGDFNEWGKPDSEKQDLAILFTAGLKDAVFKITGKILDTHYGGKSLDRILVSNSILEGTTGLKLIDGGVISHTHGSKKDTNNIEYTDHFAVWASLQAR